MTYRLAIRPDALADIAEAAVWYEEQQPGLGARFIRNAVAAIDRLAQRPLMYRERHRRLRARWCFPKSFPYRVIYRIESNVVTIVAVIHAARKDRVWKSRFS